MTQRRVQAGSHQQRKRPPGDDHRSRKPHEREVEPVPSRLQQRQVAAARPLGVPRARCEVQQPCEREKRRQRLARGAQVVDAHLVELRPGGASPGADAEAASRLAAERDAERPKGAHLRVVDGQAGGQRGGCPVQEAAVPQEGHPQRRLAGGQAHVQQDREAAAAGRLAVRLAQPRRRRAQVCGEEGARRGLRRGREKLRAEGRRKGWDIKHRRRQCGAVGPRSRRAGSGVEQGGRLQEDWVNSERRCVCAPGACVGQRRVPVATGHALSACGVKQQAGQDAVAAGHRAHLRRCGAHACWRKEPRRCREGQQPRSSRRACTRASTRRVGQHSVAHRQRGCEGSLRRQGGCRGWRYEGGVQPAGDGGGGRSQRSIGRTHCGRGGRGQSLRLISGSLRGRWACGSGGLGDAGESGQVQQTSGQSLHSCQR